MAKIDLLAALDSATAKDLAEIDDQIETLAKKLDGLKEVRKLLDVRLNGRPPKKTFARKKRAIAQVDSPDDDNSPAARRKKIANYLRVRGPSKAAIIAADLEVPVSSVYAALKDPMFETQLDGWALAKNKSDDDD